jgi:hypothetical protein
MIQHHIHSGVGQMQRNTKENHKTAKANNADTQENLVRDTYVHFRVSYIISPVFFTRLAEGKPYSQAPSCQYKSMYLSFELAVWFSELALSQPATDPTQHKSTVTSLQHS